MSVIIPLQGPRTTAVSPESQILSAQLRGYHSDERTECV